MLEWAAASLVSATRRDNNKQYKTQKPPAQTPLTIYEEFSII